MHSTRSFPLSAMPSGRRKRISFPSLDGSPTLFHIQGKQKIDYRKLETRVEAEKMREKGKKYIIFQRSNFCSIMLRVFFITSSSLGGWDSKKGSSVGRFSTFPSNSGNIVFQSSSREKSRKVFHSSLARQRRSATFFARVDDTLQ